MPPINTEFYSRHLRERAILLSEGKILISRLSSSTQEKDINTPVNCSGYGRIRHFRLHAYADWSPNPLPIVPAARALGLSLDETTLAPVFQTPARHYGCPYSSANFAWRPCTP